MTLYVKGSVRWRNGDSFTGQFSDGLRHGPGLLRQDTRDLEVSGRDVVKDMFKVSEDVTAITQEMQQIAKGNFIDTSF